MDNRTTTTIEREINLNAFAETADESRQCQKRLDSLLKANAEYARRNEVFNNDKERLEADLMSNPLSVEKSFSYFGLMLGSILPASIILKVVIDNGNLSGEDLGFLMLFAVANVGSAIAGYFSGKNIGKIIFELEKTSWHRMLLIVPFVGILWGLISGGAGGLFLFVIGALFGGILGGMVGGIALPAFTVLHRILKRGDKIESKYFYPIGFGITFTISALIFGL